MIVKYPDRKNQIVDYSGLKWGKIRPSDIDGIIEFGGKKLILLEFKTALKPMDLGQKILLEHLIQNWDAKSGNESIAIIADHYTESSEVIDGGSCIVREAYYKGKWYSYQGLNRTVKSVVERFIDDICKKGQN